MKTAEDAFDFELSWLPRAPLAAACKHGPYRRTTRHTALTLPYVETNPKALQSLIVTDIDSGDADELTGMLGLPAPSYIALNPHTRCGHIVYGLSAPVCLTDAANRRPVNLLARVESGLTTILGGDLAYAGRFTKNPTHNAHTTLWGDSDNLYTLRDLADALTRVGALPKYDDRRALQVSAIGRNVALFDHVRRWAYRRRGDYTDPTEWDEIVHAYTADRNQVFIADNFTRGPLHDTEVLHLARSISRWTWRNITRAFNQEQARRGRIMTEVKREANRRRATRYDAAFMREVVT
ncbi:replication initiation protein [Hoyosella sp. YIM 151337]|uniref:replication initiation protein n=1 Tax=Hoyosella sp. YIM 151337 TaxID=2992742 RepID=UPI002236281E|nr:replication initiation protein [Hoyosella sp. YIM 151337]MCW4355656.1 replication initiation protein [Hoyosella sp. YIM 151337]